MKFKVREGYLSKTVIDCGIWHIQRYLIEKYGCTIAENDMYPLKWYIGTGRASCPYLIALLNAKPYMIARKLHQGGSVQEVLDRVSEYIGWRSEDAVDRSESEGKQEVRCG